MEVLKEDGKFRLIQTEFCALDDDGEYATVAPIFTIQMSWGFLWLNIKEFDDISDIENSYNEAIELYNNIINPYKYYG